MNSTTSAIESIGIKDAFIKALELLKSNYRAVQHDQPKRVSCLVDDDTDHHRSVSGYMMYGSFLSVEKEGKTYALSLGTPAGYPAEGYLFDIIVIELDKEKEIQNDFREKVQKGERFGNAVFIVEKYGCIRSSKKLGLHGRDIAKFIIPNEENDLNVIYAKMDLDFSPAVCSFTPNIIPFIAEKIYASL